MIRWKKRNKELTWMDSQLMSSFNSEQESRSLYTKELNQGRDPQVQYQRKIYGAYKMQEQSQRKDLRDKSKEKQKE